MNAWRSLAALSIQSTQKATLLAFLVSHAGQNVIAHSKSFEYPLVSDVAPNPELPKTSTLEPNDITPAEIGTGTDARDLLRQVGLI